MNEIERKYLQHLFSHANVICIAPKLLPYLLNVVTDLVQQLATDSITVMEYRSSAIVCLDDVVYSESFLKSKLCNINDIILSTIHTEASDDDEDYTAEDMELSSIESDDDDSDVSDDNSLNSNDSFAENASHSEEDDEDDDAEEESGEESEIDRMYSDKENMTPYEDLFDLQSATLTSVFFKDFLSYILETKMLTGLEFSDEVMARMEQFVEEQITLSFHMQPDR